MIENTYSITKITKQGTIKFHTVYRGPIQGAFNIGGITNDFQVVHATDTNGILDYGLYKVKTDIVIIHRLND